ncbi:claudin 5, partial [Triplophysa rosa]
SHVVSFIVVSIHCGGFCRNIFEGVRGIFIITSTRETQNGASEQKHGRCCPSDVERGTDLSLLRRRDQRIVKFGDDAIGHPAQGHQHEHACDDEHHPSCAHHFGLDGLFADAVGALRAREGDDQTDDARHRRDDRQSARRLEVNGQRQDRVVHLTLHLTGALHHARHPQTVPDGLRHHDVAVDEGGHFPHGQPAGHHHQQGPGDAQSQTEKLQARGD